MIDIQQSIFMEDSNADSKKSHWLWFIHNGGSRRSTDVPDMPVKMR
jgi:hypothetical protein